MVAVQKLVPLPHHSVILQRVKLYIHEQKFEKCMISERDVSSLFPSSSWEQESDG